MSKTFDEWSAAGYKIKKGSKSTSRNDRGLPTFTSEQVEKKNMRTFRAPAYVDHMHGDEPHQYHWPDDDIPF